MRQLALQGELVGRVTQRTIKAQRGLIGGQRSHPQARQPQGGEMARRFLDQGHRDAARAGARFDVQVGDHAVAPLRRAHVMRAARLLLDPADQEAEPLVAARRDQHAPAALVRRPLEVSEVRGRDAASFRAPCVQRALEVLQGGDERDQPLPVGGLRVAHHETRWNLHA